MNNKTERATLFALTIFCLFVQPCRASETCTVRCPVSVEVPTVVTLTGTDLVTTTQNLELNASNLSFDSSLTARGSTSVMWRGNTNSNNGFMVTVQRSAITGNASEQLKNDLKLSGLPVPGGDSDATIIGTYNGGTPLPLIPEASAEPFCKTSKPGSANFQVILKLDAPSNHGQGTVKTVLTFVGASL
jgi:hypothetical protein